MADVVKIALDRRAQLHEEVARIDEFIRMGEILLNGMHPPDERARPAPRDLDLPREFGDAFRELPTMMPSEVATGNARGVSAGISRMNLMRRRPAAANG